MMNNPSSYNPHFPGGASSSSAPFYPPSAPLFMNAPPHVASASGSGAPPMPGQPMMMHPPLNQMNSLGSMELPTSTLEIRVRCDNLSDQDVFSKSDPFCVMFQKPRGQNTHWVEIGRTETIMNNLNPEWQTKFVVNYSFEERQEVKFEVYDWDRNSRNLSSHDFLGRIQTTLGQIVAASGNQFTAVLQDSPGRSTSHIFITAEEMGANKEVAYIQLAAENLDKMDFFGKSDPFFVISKGFSNGRFVVVKKSEVIKKTLNPTWAEFSIPVRDLCNNNYDRQLKIEVFDWNSSGKDDFIGSFMTTLRSLSSAAIECTKYPCINEKKVGKKKYTNSGHVLVKRYRVEKQLTFLDYIQGGTSMNFSVAIDFTASNGNPQHPSSLHYLRPGFLDNQYTTAIRACGEIIEDYDSDKMFPALGFGARIPPNGMVSHEFYLNLRTDNPYCARVDGLLQAYFNALQRVTLYGPTNFAPVIQHVTRFAQTYQDGRQYFVLLIITDGIITDMDMTKQAIIEASKYPMSIIIVGVGEEDFSAMEELDSDDKLLTYYNQKAQRDIVQFVELRKFVSARDGTWDKVMLAKEVMAEVPGQVVEWMKFKGVKPIQT